MAKYINIGIWMFVNTSVLRCQGPTKVKCSNIKSDHDNTWENESARLDHDFLIFRFTSMGNVWASKIQKTEHVKQKKTKICLGHRNNQRWLIFYMLYLFVFARRVSGISETQASDKSNDKTIINESNIKHWQSEFLFKKQFQKTRSFEQSKASWNMKMPKYAIIEVLVFLIQQFLDVQTFLKREEYETCSNSTTTTRKCKCPFGSWFYSTKVWV